GGVRLSFMASTIDNRGQTTSRIHRTTHERWRVQHLRDRTTKAKVLDRQQRQTHLPRKQREVMHHYQQVMKSLARSDRGEDRQLAVDLVRYLEAPDRTPETERERGKDRER
ncbi:hypothetical protein, partial [Nitrospira sp. BLG_1]|uniref:hypothetical protein n=1 Tax=Nitrospira sp. BLG_1 TaxID=3395883 RepID=UPI0039BCBACB